MRGGLAGDLAEAGVVAQLDHAAVAAPSIRELLPLYRDLLGGRLLNGGDNPRVGYRALQLEFPAGGRMELMEPLQGSTFFDRFFARGGGLHHVTFKVDDIHAAIEAVKEIGYTPTGVYLDSPDWREAFLHPREAAGVLVQLAQAAPGFPPPPGDMTIEDILAGEGAYGDGVPSP
jgi:methylmalonyl-CoA/ethylmalonyl-CoA epimerase